MGLRVNGKAELDLLMKRKTVRTDESSGIHNDSIDRATETMVTPRYPLEPF